MDGDRERFEALFRAHYGAVVRYAVRRVGIDAAGEIVAETFTVAWRRLDQVPDNALPWLYATARRLAAPMPWDHGGAGLSSSAYAVTSDGGTVRVTVRWAELSDPSALQAALDHAGARTRVFVETGSAFCAPKARSVGYRSGAVDWHVPRGAGAEDGIVLHPDPFPPGGTFVLVVGLAPAGSTGTPASTFGPGVPALTGTLSFMAEGPVSPPDC